MEKQVLPVLNELLEQQKEATGLLIGLTSTLNAMRMKLENIEAKVDQAQSGKMPYQQSEIDDRLLQELSEMKKLLDNLPKNVRHEKRILLFPEHNAQEYYSVVLKWVFFIIGATYAYWIVGHLVEALIFSPK